MHTCIIQAERTNCWVSAFDAWVCVQNVLEQGPGYAEDMWAFGVIVFFMLSGTTPFYASTLDTFSRATRVGAPALMVR